MNQEISISEARSKLLKMPKELHRKSHPRAITVTQRGKPVLAIVPWEFYESVLETLEIMGDPELMNALRESIKQVSRGRTVEWEEVKKELDL